jgi:hypothetical protein
MATQCAQFEPVAWWWTRNRIGEDLTELYEVPQRIAAQITRAGQEDRDWLLHNASSQNDVDLFGG